MGQSDSRSSSSDWLLRQSRPFILICSFLTITWLILEWGKGKEETHLFLNNLTREYFDGFFVLITRIGEGWIFLLAFIILIFRSFRDSIGTIVCALSVLFISGALKNWVFPEFLRPSGYFEEGVLRLMEGVDMHKNHSFPSGHTMGSFASIAYLAIFVKPKYGVWLLGLVALVAGLSRVYLSQHFLEDVVVGSWLGCFIAWGVWLWSRRWKALFFDKKIG